MNELFLGGGGLSFKSNIRRYIFLLITANAVMMFRMNVHVSLAERYVFTVSSIFHLQPLKNKNSNRTVSLIVSFFSKAEL